MFFLISLFACLTMLSIACSIVAYCIHISLRILLLIEKVIKFLPSICFSSYHAKDHFVFCHSDRFECINQIAETRENFFCGFTFYNMMFLVFLYFFVQVTRSRVRVSLALNILPNYNLLSLIIVYLLAQYELSCNLIGSPDVYCQRILPFRSVMLHSQGRYQ